MGQPVVHFEVVWSDGKQAMDFYGRLFGWEFDADNPMNYGIVDREKNLSPEGFGIGGGVGQGPEGYEGHLTFYVGVDDVEAALAKAEELGGKRVMGPEKLPTPTGEIVLGQFTDPKGQLVGLVNPA